MSALRAFRPLYTVADYNQWEGAWELWDGTAVSMTPSPFGRHSSQVARAIALLSAEIEKHNCDAEVLTELDWIVSDTTVVRPDVAVVCGAAPEEYLRTVPTLVVEVLSESTRDRDLSYKRPLYEEQGVAHYLAIDPDKNQLIWFATSSPGGWQGSVMTDLFELEICSDCRLSIGPTRLFR